MKCILINENTIYNIYNVCYYLKEIYLSQIYFYDKERMSTFWNFVFGAILIIIWLIAGGFITQANIYLGPYKNIDPDFHEAYWSTFWAAFITWFLVALFILLIILAIFGVVALFGSGAGEVGLAAEEGGLLEEEYSLSKLGKQQSKSTGVSWFTIAFLCFAIILVGVTGALATVGASSIARSPNYNPNTPNLKTAYTDCIIAAITCLVAVGILLIGLIVYFILGHQRQKKQEELIKQSQIPKPTNNLYLQNNNNNNLQGLTLKQRAILQSYNAL